MPPQKKSPLKTYFDEITETNGDDECRAWLDRVFDSKTELANFVASRCKGRGDGKYVGFLKGSFNFSFRISFSNGGSDALIRFPKPGHTATALMNEKVANEVQVIEYLSQNTTIPLPRVHSWGFNAECPQQLGPFIIMEFVDGILLSTITFFVYRPSGLNKIDLRVAEMHAPAPRGTRLFRNGNFAADNSAASCCVLSTSASCLHLPVPFRCCI